MPELFPALLIPKLTIPHLRAARVPRPALLSLLDSGLSRRLMLIAAPAGSGKTTLVAEWTALRADSVVWLSLDSADNDPARFLSYLTAAIHRRRTEIGRELLAALQSSQPPAPQHVVHSLINQFATLSQPLVIVLDDYHVIADLDVHQSVAFLLEHLPPAITLVLLTRSDPPLPLARLRARGELLELRAPALRFSVAETGQLLNTLLGLGLSEAAIAALDTRTEGWIAGLQLAAAALSSQPDDHETFVRAFTGSHRFVLDYLIEEVLDHQPAEVRCFLLETSILGRLHADLCNAITERSDGQSMLSHLDQHNLFLIALDSERQWYRYHHLFADLLRVRLSAERTPDDLRILRRRAARWHDQAGLAEEAIAYALEAEDFDHAARLISGPAAGVAGRGEVITLLRWFQAFPPAVIPGYPRLCLYFGMAFALNGRWSEAETLLGYLGDVPPNGELQLLRYLVASARGDAASLAALAGAPASSDPTAALTTALLVSLRGDWHAAGQAMAQAQDLSQRAGAQTLAQTALFHRCRFAVFAGDLHGASDLCQAALGQNDSIPLSNLALSTLGRIALEWNDPDTAEVHLRAAQAHGLRSGLVTGVLSSASMMLAEAHQARGDTQRASEAAREALDLAERYDPPHEQIWLSAYQARLWLLHGNRSAAAAWLRDLPRDPLPASMFYPASVLTVTQARVLLAQRSADAAAALLTDRLRGPEDLLTVEALLVLALARQAQGNATQAQLALGQALALAEPQRRVRVFLDLPVARLLSRFSAEHPDHRFARALLTQMPEASDQPDALSEREIAVLRLIAAGYSNEEIAERLVIALSTVKWYINTIYGKLRVKTRAQAIALVHAQRLLGE